MPSPRSPILAPLALGFAALCMDPATAAEFDSAYTDLVIDACTVTHADDFGAVWACPGHKGIPVRVAEADLRFFVSYGLESPHERAAEQTLPPFNNLGGKIEWRLSNAEGGWKPFATIVRFFVDKVDGTEKQTPGQVLVVTQIKEGATCHVAYIDALANADANALAREAADDKAFDFDCSNEPEIIGTFEAYE